MHDFQINASQAQWLTTAFMLTNGILIPVTAFLIERFSSKHLLIAALGVFSIGTIIGAIAPTFSVLLVARIVQGMGAGIMMPLMTAGISALPPHHIPHGTAMNNTIRMVGGSIGTATLISVMSHASLNISLQEPKQAAMEGIQNPFMLAVHF